MSTFNDDLRVTVVLDAAAPARQGFGALVVAFHSGLGVGFTERIRFYSTAAEAADDADLSVSARAAVTAAYLQTPQPTSVGIARVDGLEGAAFNVACIPVGVADGEDLTVNLTLNGTLYSWTHTYATGETAADICAGLVAGVPAGVLALATVTNNTNDFDIEITSWATTAEASVEAPSETPLTLTTTPAVTLEDELDDVVAADAGWYALALQSRAFDYQLAAATWCASRGRFALLQTSNEDVIGDTYNAEDPDDIAEYLKASSLAAFVVYHDNDAEFVEVAWAASRLGVNPDTNVTTWDKTPIAGYTAISLTGAEWSNLDSKSANVFSFFRRQPRGARGVVSTGTFADLIVSRDWITARIEEAVTAELLAAPARGEKIPYDGRGFSVFTSAMMKALKKGERIGHFREGTSSADAPRLEDLDNDTIASRNVTLTFATAPVGAVHGVTINGVISIAVE